MDELDSKILDVLTEKKKIHYLHLAVEVGTSSETARRRVVMLAVTYPEHIKYHKGTVELLKPLELPDLPPEKRIEALQKTLAAKEEAERKLKEKLSKNHLPHLEKAVAEGNLKQIQIEIEKLKKLLGVA